MFLECLMAFALGTWQDSDKTAREAYQQGDLTQAETSWKEGITLADQSKNVEPGVVTCMAGLAMVSERRGDKAESERLYEMAMRNLEASVGRESKEFATYMPTLALLYERHGDPHHAEVIMKECLSITRRAFGDGSWETIKCLRSYAELLRKSGREVEAPCARTRGPRP
ncbi:unnamed protein product [Sphagnum balticum]